MKHGKWDVKHGILQVSVTTTTFRALGPDPGHESGAQHGLSRVTVLLPPRNRGSMSRKVGPEARFVKSFRA